MKIIVVGGTGTIGRAVVKELGVRHQVIAAGDKSGDIRVDITDPASIEKMYLEVGSFDALVATAGKVLFKELTSFNTQDMQVGLNDKLMGQVNLVLIGCRYINERGSFTLTSGILNVEPIRFGASASMVNAAIEGFVRGAAIEMPKCIRINAVSPTIVSESLGQYGEYFHGFEPVSVGRVALAFSKSVEGLQTGRIYKVGH